MPRSAPGPGQAEEAHESESGQRWEGCVSHY